MKVALVVMPFASKERASLAVGLLKAGLERDAIECDAKYFNFTFGQLLGANSYRQLSHEISMAPQPGEWLFSQAFYGEDFSSWESYEREVLDHNVWGIADENRAKIRAALEIVPLFLRLAFESTDWGRYDLVGFTSTFQQTMPSLCLARMIREAFPRVRIAMGGANFEGSMARPYAENYEFIDFISTGEADRSFPALCRNLRDLDEGRVERLEVPGGFVYRLEGEVRETSRESLEPVVLDELPTPDYDDFFRAVRAGGNGQPANGGTLWIAVEASRGCWWGHKAHCTFCGLNADTMAFRRKSHRRVLAETDELIDRYGDLPLEFTDNILGMSYFEDLLPRWAERPVQSEKFFEIKANLKRRHVELMRRAGVTKVQPGIESLADSTLTLMRKGVSAAQNIALLRWCAEVGIRTYWNVLYAFPGESLADYGRNRTLLDKLTHLPPPTGFGPIRLDRFSPNYTAWRELGFTALEPMPAYRHIFPFDGETLSQMAYFFTYEHPQFEAALEAGSEIDGFIREWQERSARGIGGGLAVKPHWREGFVLVDDRYNHRRRAGVPSAGELALLAACDAPTTRSAALERAFETLPPEIASEGELESALDGLVEQSVIAEAEGRLVTLALMPPERSLEDYWQARYGEAASPLRRAS